MIYFKRTLIAAAVFIFANFVAVVPVATSAAIEACNGNDTAVCKSAPGDLTNGVLRNVISILLYVAGTIAVIMIIVGAIRYITSDGDSGKAATAKNTIIYAVVGLVLAVMSFGIVTFVVGRL